VCFGLGHQIDKYVKNRLVVAGSAWNVIIETE